jgi:hypothetical protein
MQARFGVAPIWQTAACELSSKDRRGNGLTATPGGNLRQNRYWGCLKGGIGPWATSFRSGSFEGEAPPFSVESLGRRLPRVGLERWDVTRHQGPRSEFRAPLTMDHAPSPGFQLPWPVDHEPRAESQGPSASRREPYPEGVTAPFLVPRSEFHDPPPPFFVGGILCAGGV